MKDTDRDVAIPRLIEEQGGRLYRLGLRFCGSHADAQDLVQETFLQAYRNWDTFEDRSAVTTWLFTIASRVCQRMHRLRAGQPKQLESLEELLPFGDTLMSRLPGRGEDPAEETMRHEMLARAETSISELPPDFRIPLILKDVIELSLEEIGAILGIKPATVKTRLHRARLRVRNSIEKCLPKVPAVAPSYDRQTCLDLLQAKQEALDRGAPFPVGRDVLCERCSSLFAELDLGVDLCRELGEGDLPPALRAAVLAHIRSEGSEDVTTRHR